jgi:hypothetical protein
VAVGDSFGIGNYSGEAGDHTQNLTNFLEEEEKEAQCSKKSKPDDQSLALTSAVNTSADVTALPLVIPVANTTTDVTSIAVAKPQKAKRKQYLNTKNK